MVEDDHATREMLRHGLRALGFQVHLAENDAEAVDLYQQHQESVTVVLLDVEIPGSDGAATWSSTAARRIGNRKLLPLLVHPATLAAQDVRSAERASAAKVEKLAAAGKSTGKHGRKRSHR